MVKMKVVILLLISMVVRTYPHVFLIYYVVHTQLAWDIQIIGVKGLKVLKVTKSCLLAERKVLEEGDLHR